MAEHFSFFDPVYENGVYDREYNAQQFTDYFKALITTGIMKSVGSQLAVTANGSNMMTSISNGVAFILGRYYQNDDVVNLTHDTETLGNSRIDRIVIRMDLSPDKRHVLAFVKKGVPSANPVPPLLTQTPTVYEISLAQVVVVGGQTFIAIDAVTDERGIDVICPWAGSNILPSFDNNALAEHINTTKSWQRHKITSDNGTAINISGKNLNNITTSGIYNGDALINSPDGGPQWWYIEVIEHVHKGGFLIQKAYSLFGLVFKVRICTSGNWSNWSDDLFGKANILQEAGFSLTLENGWTGNVKCYKDNFGRVQISGVPSNGVNTTGTRICTLPTGYRPSSTEFIGTHTEDGVNTGTSLLLVVGSNGTVTLGSTAKKYIYINTSFRV